MDIRIKEPLYITQQGQEYIVRPGTTGVERNKIVFFYDVTRTASVGFPREVCVETPLTSNKIVETVFISVFGNNLEAKLINDYNAAMNGVLDESFKQVYLRFLKERKRLKERIECDWKAFEEAEEFINNNKVKNEGIE